MKKIILRELVECKIHWITEEVPAFLIHAYKEKEGSETASIEIIWMVIIKLLAFFLWFSMIMTGPMETQKITTKRHQTDHTEEIVAALEAKRK